MNWLAHIFLSEQDIDFQIANYLADPLKARAWQGANSAIHQGMQTHIHIDSFTDQHPLFLQSKQRLKSKGLLRGIVIDLTYDYLLTKNWERFCNIPLKAFLDTYHDEAKIILPSLPIEVQKPLQRMVDFEILHQYQTLNQLHEAFQRVDKKVSQRVLKRDNATHYHDAVTKNIDKLEEDFLDFFPALCQHIKPLLNENRLNHWRI